MKSNEEPTDWKRNSIVAVECAVVENMPPTCRNAWQTQEFTLKTRCLHANRVRCLGTSFQRVPGTRKVHTKLHHLMTLLWFCFAWARTQTKRKHFRFHKCFFQIRGIQDYLPYFKHAIEWPRIKATIQDRTCRSATRLSHCIDKNTYQAAPFVWPAIRCASAWTQILLAIFQNRRPLWCASSLLFSKNHLSNGKKVLRFSSMNLPHF